MAKVRIQKVLAEAGVASRRHSEELVVEGHVMVNGEVVRDLPIFVDPQVDEILVDHRPIRKKATPRVYFLLNKPKGVICTQSTAEGKPRAVDLVPSIPERIYCVGRLDVDSTGVILLTNDGELTNLLTHPRYGVPKTYVVEIDGKLDEEQAEQLKKGMYLDGKRTQAARVKVLRRHATRSLLEIQLTEGRNREIRRLLLQLGHKVRKLKRVAIADVTDRGLKVGGFRALSRKELAQLRAAAGEAETPRRRKRS